MKIGHLWITIFHVLFSVCSMAQSSTEAVAGSDKCPECETANLQKVRTEVALIKKILGSKLNCEGRSSEDCTLINWLQWKHESYAEECKKFFVNAEGSLGENSKEVTNLILEDIEQVGDQSLFLKTNPDFDQYCPNFKNFTLAQKVAFHAWIFELTAFPESTCRVGSPSNPHAPTTKAVCMYQLEDKPDVREWRSSRFKNKRCAVSEKEILTLKGCTGCAFDEYKRKNIVHGTPFGSFTQDGTKINKSYWASHNPLHSESEKCFEANGGHLKPVPVDPKTKRPLWLVNCGKNANLEWRPRYLFFKRLQRFPLCGTELAAYELQELEKRNGAK